MPRLTHIFFNGFLVFLVMCMYEGRYVSVGADRGQRYQIHPELWSQVVLKCLVWVMGDWSSIRGICALKC